MFTIIPYLYTDAANYKEGSEIVIEGVLTQEQIENIRSKLDDGENFIPHDLGFGLDELQERLTSFPSEDDHVWHELQLDDLKVVKKVPEGTSTIDSADFIAAFEKIADCNSWNVVGAVERLDLPM